MTWEGTHMRNQGSNSEDSAQEISSQEASSTSSTGQQEHRHRDTAGPHSLGEGKACLQLIVRIQSRQTPYTATITNPWEAGWYHDFTRRTCLPHQSLSVRGAHKPPLSQKWMENTPTQFVSFFPAPCQPVSTQVQPVVNPSLQESLEFSAGCQQFEFTLKPHLIS